MRQWQAVVSGHTKRRNCLDRSPHRLLRASRQNTANGIFDTTLPGYQTRPKPVTGMMIPFGTTQGPRVGCLESWTLNPSSPTDTDCFDPQNPVSVCVLSHPDWLWLGAVDDVWCISCRPCLFVVVRWLCVVLHSLKFSIVVAVWCDNNPILGYWVRPPFYLKSISKCRLMDTLPPGPISSNMHTICCWYTIAIIFLSIIYNEYFLNFNFIISNHSLPFSCPPYIHTWRTTLEGLFASPRPST